MLLDLVEFKQSSGALGVPCYMTDRGARPSLWRRPGLVLRTTGDVTPVTIYNSAVRGPARLKSCCFSHSMRVNLCRFSELTLWV